MIPPELISAFGLSGSLSEEKQIELLDRLGGVVFQKTLIHCFGQMSMGEKNEVDRLIAEKKSPQEVFDYLKLHVPTCEAILKEEIQMIQKEINP